MDPKHLFVDERLMGKVCVRVVLSEYLACEAVWA